MLRSIITVAVITGALMLGRHGMAAEAFQKLTIPLIAAGKPDPADQAVTGYLFRPAGNGPFPAAVLMHGCDGMEWERPGQPGWTLFKSYAERYVQHGFVALVLDSFQPRGIDQICGHGDTVSPTRRAWDAYSAARMLRGLPYVDGKRLVLQGDSHGGLTVLVAMLARPTPPPEQFAAAIAFYPWCIENAGFSAPLLILIGSADDWTPARRCQDMVAALAPGTAPVSLEVFPGATHAFDFPFLPRTNLLGHFMRYDRKATEASWQSIDEFLARTLK